MRGDGNGATASREAILAALHDGERFLLATHENPDGDALGSLVGMNRLLRALGKDTLMFMAPEEFPLPYEYRFIELDGLVTEAPADADERIIVFLDCGNIDRNPADALKRPNARILNVDHHHDNTRFGTVDHVVPDASCTAEIVWDLMNALGMSPSVEMAEALYVGLVTDTGKFMYENTGPRAHAMAAALIEAGIDVHAIYRRLFEGVPQAKLDLLARGLANIERYEDGLLTLTLLSKADYAEVGAEEAYSEGVVDHLRALEGTAVAGLVRDRVTHGRSTGRKVSLRASDDRVDVSAIAREQGGGGHRRAAGFSTDMEWEELVAFLRGAVAQALAPVHG
ncbi:MAG: RecJ [uncultured Solirubrobacteraceae bacterium]|uniref:RecJ n=1 Tax=uncultured Solirubrobacteraceae bacterium TaxID=1162706 RepID=A0A6J4RCN6_9ACTN|nr:MAG: RecJ [uncultured Solirubrobacteraceae bacterium]